MGLLRGALEEDEGRIEALRVPGNLRSSGRFHDAQTRLVEDLGDRQAASANHLGQGMCVDAVGTRLRRSDRSRRGVEGEEQARARFVERQSARQGLALDRVGKGARGVEHDDRGLQSHRGERLQIVGETRAVQRDIGVARDGRADREKIIVAFELRRRAREVDEGDAVGACGARLFEKVAQ